MITPIEDRYPLEIKPKIKEGDYWGGGSYALKR
jgi:hypothetical protein